VDFTRLGPVEGDAPEELANTEEARRLRTLIWSAVGELTLPQKASVLMFYREGKSCEEIGRVLEMPTVTIKSHLHRARSKLRELLQAKLMDGWQSIPFLSDARSA
jgi:RNA polymerase sigma-70 factor (ECF subfamily)